MVAQVRGWFLALLMVWALSHASVHGNTGEPVQREPSPAEKIRKVLDQPMSLDFTGASLQEMAVYLKEKTRINFVIDVVALHHMGVALDERNGQVPQVQLKSDRTGRLRTSIQRTLNAYNLTYVVMEDSVLITTDEIGVNRQMRQRVNVNLADAQLGAALKDLARNTGLNLVIDPRLGREADVKLSLQLEDATLETAVRIIAELGNLKAVRMGNMLFVTNESRAEKLRREEAPVVVPALTPM